MQKDFDRWNESKKNIDADVRGFDFHEREIWWCCIGVNVGSEQHSQTEDFSRPVLIVKRFSPNVFWGIPLTTKLRDDIPFRFRLVVEDMQNDVLIEQMRAFDKRRLLRKLSIVPKEEFGFLRKTVMSIFE